MAALGRVAAKSWASIESKLPPRVQNFMNHPAGMIFC